MRRTWAIAVFLVALLAGCTGDIPQGAPGVPPSALQPGQYYAFLHGGGALTFTLAGQGEASFELYGADDQRIGGAGLSASGAQQGLHRITGIAPGDIVVRLLTLTGDLQIDSGSQRVDAFVPVLTSIQRILLLDLPPSNDPLAPLGIPGIVATGDDFDGKVDVLLPRAPADLRVLASGPWDNLRVAIDGDTGRMLDASDPAGSGGSLVGEAQRLQSIAGTVTPQNLRAGNVTATIQADHLAGAVVLEIETFSRAAHPLPGPVGPDPEAVVFSYGSLPAGPVVFTVHPRAKTLALWQPNGAQDAHVAIFGPHDEPLGVVTVPAGGSTQVATQGGGEYVAVRLDANVSLGADRSPAAFDLRPLEVREETLPSSVAGSNGRYAMAQETASRLPYQILAGQVAAAAPELTEAVQFRGCDGGRFLEVLQDNETLATIFDGMPANELGPAFALASQALRDGPVLVRHDGFGDDGCPRPAVTLRSYERAV